MSDRPTKADFLILAGLSLTLFLYHFATSLLSGYGYFCDELYYIACSKRLAFGYVDHPPLSVFLLALSRRILGESIPAIRILPALGVASMVFLTGLLARSLGGSRLAMIIAALAAMVMPVYLVTGSNFSMNAFEPLLFTAILFFAIRMIQKEDPRYWLTIGLLMGIGLEMKHTMAVYIIALLGGMLLTSSRRYLWNRWFLYGLLGCGLLILPNLIWQYTHGFPSLEFYHNATVYKNIPTSPLKAIFDQVLVVNPFTLPVWIAGLIFFLFLKEAKRYRFYGWACVILFMVMILSGSSRPDRIGSIYTGLFAAGAVVIVSLKRSPVRLPAIALTISLLISGGLAAAPIFTPLLPPSVTGQYISLLGLSLSMEKGKENGVLPQWLADRLGWRELASDVARVYHALPIGEQRNAVIISTSYSDAGALELFGPRFDLPPVFATHNNYHLWGPPPDSVKTYIVVFAKKDDLERLFDSVTEGAVHTCKDCSSNQRRIPIYVVRGPRFSMAAEWPKFKNFI